MTRKNRMRFFIEQGRSMDPASPSLIEADLESDADSITRLLPGNAYVSGEKCVEIDF